MNTGHYITPDEIIFNASAMSGDRDYKALPKGVYLSFIQDAFRELNMSTLFAEQRFECDMPHGLVMPLPEDCFDVKNIYIFNGDICNVSNSRKVWWKRNYYTKGGHGYIANDKGQNNYDPYYASRTNENREDQNNITNVDDKSLIRWDDRNELNDVLFYNMQMGNLMFSSSCRKAGTKVHIHYQGTGGNIIEAPIIPLFFKGAIEDFVIEAILRVRMANEPAMAKMWQGLQQTYAIRLDKNGFNGSWHTALMHANSMSTSQREELKEYLGRNQWSRGF